ncbi:hypothetical protein, partial [Oleiphilus sp. HI0079]|uniref:hypothetical protein n=1 Tax=Oleiphilus sp. HI0079 TaxID=1822254 RepID=UPI001E33FD25
YPQLGVNILSHNPAEEKVKKLKNAILGHRLPCRGCTSDCSNYATCDGKPWRMTPSTPEKH